MTHAESINGGGLMSYWAKVEVEKHGGAGSRWLR